MAPINKDKEVVNELTRTNNVLDCKQSKNCFASTSRKISHLSGDVFLSKLEYLAVVPHTFKMPFFLVVDRGNSRKLATIAEFLRRHPSVPESYDGCIEKKQPVVYAKTSKKPNEGGLYSNILQALDVNYRKTDAVTHKLVRLNTYFRLFGVKILILDNFHYSLRGSKFQKDTMINVVKSLSNRLAIPIVLIGDKTIITETDDRLWISSDYLPILLPRRPP